MRRNLFREESEQAEICLGRLWVKERTERSSGKASQGAFRFDGQFLRGEK